MEEGDDEIMWVKIEHQNREVDYIGCVYGLQERNRIEEVERQFNNITTQIEIAQNRGQVILAGDFNAKIKVEKREYIQATSRNGRLLENMLETTKCTAANLKSTTGLWTRQNRSNTNEKSIIDYIITCDQMEKRIENIEVDEKGTLRMKNDRTETDHNSIIVQVTIPRASKESQREKVWKLRNEEGWSKYNRILRENLRKLKDDDSYANFNKAITKTLYETIGQRTITKKKRGKRKRMK